MKVRCTSCRAVLKAPDSAAGRVIKCPKCETKLRIPKADPEPIEDYGDPGFDDYGPADDGFDDLSDLGDYGYPGPATGGRKKPCPACAEPVSVNATRCKYCGEDLSAPPRRRKKRRKRRRRERTYSISDDDLGIGEILLCVILSGCGCIVGLVYMAQGDSRGWKMITISVIATVIKSAIFGAIRAGLERGGP